MCRQKDCETTFAECAINITPKHWPNNTDQNFSNRLEIEQTSLFGRRKNSNITGFEKISLFVLLGRKKIFAKNKLIKA